MVTELATGGELFDHIIAKGHYTEPDAQKVAAQVLQAVSYLHEQDVIHRDIKPENILVSYPAATAAGEPSLPGSSTEAEEESPPPVVKLSDFGLAKFIGDGAQMAMTTCGTPTYSAPEVWKGTYTNKVDCYSIGVLIFVMLSGHFPKVNEKGPIFFGKVWGQVSREAIELIGQLMDPDAEKRISAKAAMDHPWILGDVPCTPLSSARERLKKEKKAGAFDIGLLEPGILPGAKPKPKPKKPAGILGAVAVVAAGKVDGEIWGVPQSEPPVLLSPPPRKQGTKSKSPPAHMPEEEPRREKQGGDSDDISPPTSKEEARDVGAGKRMRSTPPGSAER